MTDRARKLLEVAMMLSDEERLDLAEQLLSSLPADEEWLGELERVHVELSRIRMAARRGMSSRGGWMLA